MDVQPQVVVEQVVRDDQPVCDRDDHGRAELEAARGALRLEHGNSEPRGGELRR